MAETLVSAEGRWPVMINVDRVKDIFISYRSPNVDDEGKPGDPVARGVAHKLAKIFEDDFGIPCFMDAHSIAPGQDFVTVIKKAVEKADVVICLLSAPYHSSTWCETEKMWAQNFDKAVLYKVEKDYSFSSAQGGSSTINIGDLSDWNGSADDPNFTVCLDRIGEKTRRRNLMSLARAVSSNDDAELFEWCGSNPDEVAAKMHLKRMYKDRLDFLMDENSRKRGSVSELVARKSNDLRRSLDKESEALQDFERDARMEQITWERCGELRRFEAVDPEEHSHAENVLKQQLNEKEQRIRELENAEDSLERAGRRFEATIVEKDHEIVALKAEVDKVRADMKRMVEDMSPDRLNDAYLEKRVGEKSVECLRAYSESKLHREQARKNLSTAQALRQRIENAIERGECEYQVLGADKEFELRRIPAEEGAPVPWIGRFTCRLGPGGQGIRHIWGYHNNKLSFSGVGAIEFGTAHRPNAVFFGGLVGMEPYDAECCVIQSSHNSGIEFEEWEGMWPRKFDGGWGRLKRSEGAYFGNVRMQSFLQLVENSYGVFRPNSTTEAEVAGIWEDGVLVREFGADAETAKA